MMVITPQSTAAHIIIIQFQVAPATGKIVSSSAVTGEPLGRIICHHRGMVKATVHTNKT